MESSRAEELLKGIPITHEQSTITEIKKVNNTIRQITLANGKKIHVTKERVKSLVDGVLRAQAKAKSPQPHNSGMHFVGMLQRRG